MTLCIKNHLNDFAKFQLDSILRIAFVEVELQNSTILMLKRRMTEIRIYQKFKFTQWSFWELNLHSKR